WGMFSPGCGTGRGRLVSGLAEEIPGGSYDLTPRSTRITGPELLYLEQPSSLVRTPRAATGW
ncbi:MAG: hypothetical protein QOF58_4272, partial [Pseudonocardiales bacterium]|nr:hypothetical protein [Pseudonocardiales bacterium]